MEKLKILFGFSEPEFESAVKNLLKSQGYETEIAARFSRETIKNYIMKNPDTDAAVLLEVLPKTDGQRKSQKYTAEEVAQLTDASDVNVILVLSENHRGTDYMRTLFAAGITCAFFQGRNNGARPRDIAGLILQKRTRKAAREYYGIGSGKLDLGFLENADYSELYDRFRSHENPVEGYLAVCALLNAQQIADFTRRLPGNDRDYLAGFEEFHTVMSLLKKFGVDLKIRRPRKVSIGLSSAAQITMKDNMIIVDRQEEASPAAAVEKEKAEKEKKAFFGIKKKLPDEETGKDRADKPAETENTEGQKVSMEPDCAAETVQEAAEGGSDTTAVSAAESDVSMEETGEDATEEMIQNTETVTDESVLPQEDIPDFADMDLTALLAMASGQNNPGTQERIQEPGSTQTDDPCTAEQTAGETGFDWDSMGSAPQDVSDSAQEAAVEEEHSTQEIPEEDDEILQMLDSMPPMEEKAAVVERNPEPVQMPEMPVQMTDTVTDIPPVEKTVEEKKTEVPPVQPEPVKHEPEKPAQEPQKEEKTPVSSRDRKKKKAEEEEREQDPILFDDTYDEILLGGRKKKKSSLYFVLLLVFIALLAAVSYFGGGLDLLSRWIS